MAKERREQVVDKDATRADLVVRALTGVSRSWVRGMFDHGCVSVDGQPCPGPGTPVQPGTVVAVVYEPGRHYREKPHAHPHHAYRLVYEDSRIVVVDKTAGILTVPTDRGEEDTLVAAVAAHFSHGRVPQEAYVVHRLDRDTSGLLVFARTLALAKMLQEQFKARKPEREYAAIVRGRVGPDTGTFRSYLAMDESFDEVSSGDSREGRLAVTHYAVVERLRDATFVRVNLETGRRNQIRVQFADEGHPVLGDTRYSPELARHPDWQAPRLALHARTLAFEHPHTHKTMRFTTDLPAPFAAFIAATRLAPTG